MAIKPVEIVINAKDKATPVVKDVARAMDSIDPAAKRAGAAADVSMETLRQRSEQAASAAGGVANKLDSVKNQLLTLVGVDLGAGLVKDIAATADEFRNLESKIKLVVGESGDVAGTIADVKTVAQETFTSLDGTVQLFSRLAASADELNISQGDALDITRTINQSIQVSGASAQAADSAVKQLVQGLQSGVLRGDEFNSVMEQAPRLARALADGLGVPIGALRQMAEEGKLTASAVVGALQGQRQAIESEFTQLPLTIGRAVQNLKTEFVGFVGVLDGTTGASTLVAQGIQGLADQLDVVARVAGAAGAALTAGLAVQGVAALTAAGGAASVLGSNLNAIPKIINITVAAVGFEVGFQIGEMLTENFALARQLGVGIVEFMQQQVNSLTFIKEAAAAVFTDDTVEAALERYNQRAVQMRAIFLQMYQDAKEPPKAIEEGASRAAKALGALGDEAARVARQQKAAAEELARSASTEAQALQANAIARSTDAKVALSGLQTKRELARQAVELARLTGDETAQRKALVAQMTIEIEITKAKANVARIEAEGSILVAQATLSELKAKGELTPVKEAELRASISLAQAKIAEANATGQSTRILEEQLRLLKQGAGAAGGMADNTSKLAGAQRDLARSVGAANTALEKQAQLDKSRYGRPGEGNRPGPNDDGKYYDPGRGSPYARPGDVPRNGYGQSQADYQRTEKLKGQGASDETLRFALLDKLKAGTLSPEDLDELRAVVQTLKNNEAIFRNITPGGSSLEALEDDRKWSAARQGFEQAIAKFSGGSGGQAVGRTVNVKIDTGAGIETMDTDERGAQAVVRALGAAARRAGR